MAKLTKITFGNREAHAYPFFDGLGISVAIFVEREMDPLSVLDGDFQTLGLVIRTNSINDGVVNLNDELGSWAQRTAVDELLALRTPYFFVDNIGDLNSHTPFYLNGEIVHKKNGKVVSLFTDAEVEYSDTDFGMILPTHTLVSKLYKTQEDRDDIVFSTRMKYHIKCPMRESTSSVDISLAVCKIDGRPSMARIKVEANAKRSSGSQVRSEFTDVKIADLLLPDGGVNLGILHELKAPMVNRLIDAIKLMAPTGSSSIYKSIDDGKYDQFDDDDDDYV